MLDIIEVSLCLQGVQEVLEILDVLDVLEVLDVALRCLELQAWSGVCRVLLCMQEAMEGEPCLLEVLDVLESMHCLLLCYAGSC